MSSPCVRFASVLGLVAGAAVLVPGGGLDAAEGPAAPPIEAAAFEPLDVPVRLLDTRAPGGTIDGVASGAGRPGSGSVVEVPISGRGGIDEPAAVAVNLTAVDAAGPGFVTAHRCGGDVPVASNLNFAAGDTVANLALLALDGDGRVCLYIEGSAHLLLDVTGQFDSDGFAALEQPLRFVDTRPGAPTFDGLMAGAGELPAASTMAVPIAGRGGLDAGLATVVLNVTVTEPADAGFVTVYPCEQPRPNASNLNHGEGRTVAGAVVTGLSPDGEVCVHTSARTGLIVDVAGVIPPDGFTALPTPRRLLDTRNPASTFDASDAGSGFRPAGGTYRLGISGRAGVPADASAVVLTVTAVDAEAHGFVTVHPSGTARPNASNLNHGDREAGSDTVANSVVTRLGPGGAVCLFTSAPAELVVDVAGWLPGPPPPPGSADCPPTPPSALAEQWTMLLARDRFVNAAIVSGLSASEVRAQFPTTDPPVGGQPAELIRHYCWFAGGLCVPPTSIAPGVGSVSVTWAPEERSLLLDAGDGSISYVLPPFSPDQRRSSCAVFDLAGPTPWTTTSTSAPDETPGVVWVGQPRPEAIPSGDVQMTWGPSDAAPFWGTATPFATRWAAGHEWELSALDDGVQATTIAPPPHGCGRYTIRTAATGGDPAALEHFLDALDRS